MAHRTLAVLAAVLVAGPAQALVPQPGTQAGQLTVPLVSSNVCAACHAYGAPESPYASWSGTMMANASRDPLARAALAIAEQDVPEVGDMCLRCHAPVGWLGGRVTVGSPPPTHGEALLPDDLDGVNCHVCHRMTPGPDGKVLTENAQLFVADDDVRRGPWEYPFPDSTFVPPHEWRSSPLHTSSELCGQCHDVTNPGVSRRDGTGRVVASTFPLERTFAEWQASSFSKPGGQTCQDCHMPAISSARACSWGSAPLHDEVPRHDFAGANAWMPTVFAGELPDLQRGAAFEAARQNAVDMLQERSATLAIDVGAAPSPGWATTVRVRVTNLTGHKLPTGYAEGRRMWLRFEASAGGSVVFRSGDYDDAAGNLVHASGVKIYEARHGLSGVGPTFHFVLNDTIVKDNRIPPLGFVPASDTAPVGASFEVLPEGILANYDDTFYTVAVPLGASGDLVVTAELWYQTATREYVEFLRDNDRARDAGRRVYDLWQKYGRSPPVKMTRAQVTAAIEQRPSWWTPAYWGGGG